MSALPMLGNLAWIPVPAADEVEVLDRFNGVPTLGVISTDGERLLVWRAYGYVPEKVSVWLYVPLDDQEYRRLQEAEAGDLLTGLVFNVKQARYATVGVALDYRLVFEREWQIPARDNATLLLSDLVKFLHEALTIALEQDLPLARRQLMCQAYQAVKELADA